MTEAGGSYWIQQHTSSDGQPISETYGDYLSHDKARASFEKELRNAITIYEHSRTDSEDGGTGEQVIGLFKAFDSDEQFVSIVGLSARFITHAEADSSR